MYNLRKVLRANFFLAVSLGISAALAHSTQGSSCAHDSVLHAYNEQHINTRFLRLMDNDGQDILPFKLSRNEMRHELADRGVERLADDHRRRLTKSSLADIRGQSWKPLRIAYKKVDWLVDPAMDSDRQDFLEGVMDEAVEIFKNTFFVSCS